MSNFRKVSPGTSKSLSPANSSAWLNQVTDMLVRNQQTALGVGSGGTSPIHSLVNPVKVRNLTGSNRLRGEVVQLGASLLDPFDPRNPWFEGNTYDQNVARPIGILTKATPTDAIHEVAVTGVCVALVNVTSLSHRYAVPVDGSVTLASADSGAIEILSPRESTGLQEVFALLGAAEDTVTVYLFTNCTNPDRTLYLDNPEIATHEEGEVAIVRTDGVDECWLLVGPAPRCKTGECADIINWKKNCNPTCYNLTPCGGGSPIVVRDLACATGWGQYIGKTLKLDGPGVEGCYEVSEADGCFDVNNALTAEHIVAVYEHCDGCGCYELTHCTTEDTTYIDNDLYPILGVSGVDAIGRFIKHHGQCYQVTAFSNPCGATPTHWEDDPVAVESCDACCYKLTPCPDQLGDPDPIFVRPIPTDEIDLEEFAEGERVIRLADDICYSVSRAATGECEDPVSGLGAVKETYDHCSACKITCWQRCDDEEEYIATYSDMSEWTEGDLDSGYVLRRAEDGLCYKESTLIECEGKTPVEFTVEEVYDEGEESCAICMDPRVKLTRDCGEGCSDCAGGTEEPEEDPDVVTDNVSLVAAVKKWVKMDGKCYYVDWTTDSLTGTVGCWSGPYLSCEACQAAPTTMYVLGVAKDGTHKEIKIEFIGNICKEQTWDDECD